MHADGKITAAETSMELSVYSNEYTQSCIKAESNTLAFVY
jgi:hypothetical protein